MSPEISERPFEEAVECARLQYGTTACPGDSTAVREAIERLKELRTALISAAVTGKIDVCG